MLTRTYINGCVYPIENYNRGMVGNSNFARPMLPTYRGCTVLIMQLLKMAQCNLPFFTILVIIHSYLISEAPFKFAFLQLYSQIEFFKFIDNLISF